MFISPSRSTPVKRTAIVISSVAAVSFLAACSTGDGESSAPETGGSIAIAISTDPSSFDPVLAAGQHTFQVDSFLYDTLIRRDDDSALVGGLATEWEVESASEYLFTIRDDATCSDGSPITPTVVADSLSYLANPETGSTWKALVFGQGDATITPDDEAGTVRVSLSQPFTNLESGLTASQTGIICPEGLADLEGLAAGTVDGAFSGPYTISESNAGIGYTLALREDYDAWPKLSKPLEGVPADTIELTLSSDESTMANQIMSGDLDFAQLADYNTIERFASDDSYHKVEVTGYTTYVIFNQREGRVFADNPEARQAVARAVDQDAFNTVFSNGNSEVLTSIVPSSFACVNTDESLLEEHDPDAAAEVLSSVDGIKMLGNTANSSFTNGADYLYEVVTAAGAGVDLSMADNATFWSTLANGESDWDMVFIGDANTVQVISASLDRVTGPSVEEGGRNYSGSSNPDGEAALAAGLSEIDEDVRCDAFQTAQESLFERDDVVPLVGGTTTTVTSPNVTVRAFGDYLDYATVRVIAE